MKGGTGMLGEDLRCDRCMHWVGDVKVFDGIKYSECMNTSVRRMIMGLSFTPRIEDVESVTGFYIASNGLCDRYQEKTA